MKRLVTIVCATLAGVWIAGNTLAEELQGGDQPAKHTLKKGEGRMGGGWEAGMGMENEGMIARVINNAKLAEEAGISEEQISTLKKELEELRKGEKDLRDAVEKAGEDQAKLMTDKNLDENAVLAAIDKISEKRTALAKLQVKKLFLIRKTLTEEQIQKIKELIKKHRENAGKGRKKEGGGKANELAPATVNGNMKPID